ncbi:MAG: hypothetical protein HN576_16095 [Bacteriovoracaceae bacterium]|jgi:hypothetical protein|nr:hypothetical protein [Bacteriovoracaceae bacterium]
MLVTMDICTLDNLKIENNRSEIIATLIRMYRETTPVLVWQNNLNGTKLMKNSLIDGIFPELGNFVLTPLPESDVFDFCNTSTIYIRGNERSILFKEPKIVIYDKKIIVQIPRQVRMYDKRYSERFHFGLKSNYRVEIFHQKKSLNEEQIFQVSLFDISDKGASFNLSLLDQKNFNQEEVIKLVRLGNKFFPDYLMGKIIYLHRLDNKIGGIHCPSIKMGVKFDRCLSKNELAEIKSVHH